MSLRPILADTEDAAWARARAEKIAQTTESRVGAFTGKRGFAGGLSSSVGRLRLVEHADRAYEDAVEYGEKLLPLLRASVVERDAQLSEAV